MPSRLRCVRVVAACAAVVLMASLAGCRNDTDAGTVKIGTPARSARFTVGDDDGLHVELENGGSKRYSPPPVFTGETYGSGQLSPGGRYLVLTGARELQGHIGIDVLDLVTGKRVTLPLPENCGILDEAVAFPASEQRVVVHGCSKMIVYAASGDGVWKEVASYRGASYRASESVRLLAYRDNGEVLLLDGAALIVQRLGSDRPAKRYVLPAPLRAVAPTLIGFFAGWDGSPVVVTDRYLWRPAAGASLTQYVSGACEFGCQPDPAGSGSGALAWTRLVPPGPSSKTLDVWVLGADGVPVRRGQVGAVDGGACSGVFVAAAELARVPVTLTSPYIRPLN